MVLDWKKFNQISGLSSRNFLPDLWWSSPWRLHVKRGGESIYSAKRRDHSIVLWVKLLFTALWFWLSSVNIGWTLNFVALLSIDHPSCEWELIHTFHKERLAALVKGQDALREQPLKVDECERLSSLKRVALDRSVRFKAWVCFEFPIVIGYSLAILKFKRLNFKLWIKMFAALFPTAS